MQKKNEDRPAVRGRPPASSRAVLEEAAYELFLEQGYSNTTAAHIASRAGVSRGTFFNYFASKADVFWVDLDTVLADLPGALAATDPALRPPIAIRHALLEAAAGFGPDRVPWILTQFEAIGRPTEVIGAATQRLVGMAETLEGFLRERSADEPQPGLPKALAYAIVGAACAAAQEWAEAGYGRDPLSVYLARTLTAVGVGYRDAASDVIAPE